LKRLESEIGAFKKELKSRGRPENIVDVVTAAESAVADGDIDAGWKYLQTARRLELEAAGAKSNAAASTIRNEADKKLSGWRKEAVNELLTVPSGTALELHRIIEAARLCDEHSNNESYKNGLRRSNALRLAFFLLGAIIALFYVASEGYLSEAIKSPPPTDRPALLQARLSVAVFGWLGATISAITKLPPSEAPSRIPELTSTFRITALRLMMGPASAIILYFAMHSTVSKSIFQTGVVEGYLILIVAFVSGFSERLVVRVVEAIDK
jgi:hypothetical protein